MRNKISLGSLGTLVLGCDLVFVVYRANNKLQSGNIGTIFRDKDEETVQASRISFSVHIQCPRETRAVSLQEGRLY